MSRLSTLSSFKPLCPFLQRTQTSQLRSLCTSSSPRFPAISALTERATKCPVMGPALDVRGKQLAAGYASVAGQADVEKIHQDQGITIPPNATVEMCPHAKAARDAARIAEDLAAAAASKQQPAKKAGGCTFHAAQAQAQDKPAAAPKETVATAAKKGKSPKAAGGFDYEKFYEEELDKKHQDKSYRYFNNINRLAARFPTAHTAKVTDEVEVWCSNDYLGMGGNPVVLETMQYVSTLICIRLLSYRSQPRPRQVRPWRRWHAQHRWQRCPPSQS